MADFADRPPHHLSFGQRRRVAVATVLAMEPEILVLDEPSSNLDPASRRELADILRSLDVTVLMVTHDLPYALELCPRSVVLSDGHVVADGATYDVLTDERPDARAPARAAVRLRPPHDRPGLPAVARRARLGYPADVSDELADLEREIEETRERLAGTIDQLLHRSQPQDDRQPPGRQIKGHYVDAGDAASRAPTTSSRPSVASSVPSSLIVVLRRVTR